MGAGILAIAEGVFSAAALMAPEVKTVFETVKGLVPASPNSPAEIALAAVIKKDMPTVNGTQLTAIKHLFGQATAIIRVTMKVGSRIDDTENVEAMVEKAKEGIELLGLDASKLRRGTCYQMAYSAIVCSEANLGVAVPTIAVESSMTAKSDS